jgi:FlaA1/EpsC-like NDP-sugar epimerase
VEIGLRMGAMTSSVKPEPRDPNKGLSLWWTRLLTRPIQFLMDLSVLVMAFVLSYLLRFDFTIPEERFINLLAQLPYIVSVQFGALLVAGVYSFIWRYIGMRELRAFMNAACWSLLPIAVLRLGLPGSMYLWRVPLSIALIDTGVAFGGVLALRVLRRALYERYQKQKAGKNRNADRKPVLLIGAGRAGVLAAKEIFGRGDNEIEIRGFVDDDPSKRGAVIQGVKVLGSTQDLPRLVREEDVDHVVITIAEASGQDIRRIVRICEEISVRVRIIPGLYEILQGRVEVSRIRDVQIEDLLGRETVQLDEENIAYFLAGKTIVVTGAGGSIGSELARQVARFHPARLLLVERAEFALFNVDRELRENWPELSIEPLVADIGDEARMRWVLSQYRPNVILHAAAHKHVPMMEFNAVEAVKNNVLATRMLGELAGEFGVETFVLISSDKAVRPTSVMGATKRIAELLIQGLDYRYATHYVAVRFGNVIGSTGSVMTIFREQIRRGGPVTVTHPDMIRYFMTIPEAAQLVLQAGAMGDGGEIFILDMGNPVRIHDLAVDTIKLSGLRPYEDIDIVFTGMRPGEKLFEELETGEEGMSRTRHPKIFIGRIAAYPAEVVIRAVRQLTALCHEGHEQDLRDYLGEFLPESRLSRQSETTLRTRFTDTLEYCEDIAPDLINESTRANIRRVNRRE